MKKILNTKTIILLVVIVTMILGINTMCFADLYVPGGSGFSGGFSSPLKRQMERNGIQLLILIIALFVLIAVWLINLLVMLIGKIKKSNKAIDITKNVNGKLVYSILLWLGIISIWIFFKLHLEIAAGISFIAILLSLVLRKFNEKLSYIIIIVYLVVFFATFPYNVL